MSIESGRDLDALIAEKVMGMVIEKDGHCAVIRAKEEIYVV